MSKAISLMVLICTLAFAISVFAIIRVSNQRRADVNDKLARQHEICVEVNSLKQILHDEHKPKLATAARNVKRYPHGITLTTDQGKLRVSRADLIRSRNAEAKIVRDTKKKPC